MYMIAISGVLPDAMRDRLPFQGLFRDEIGRKLRLV
jgi:hypothetical protein